MIKAVSKCSVCGFQSVYMGGYFSFLPVICCEETKHLKRRITHNKRAK